MGRILSSLKYYGASYLMELPNVCPYCHVTHKPDNHWVAESKELDGTPSLITGWLCTSERCARIFLVLNVLNSDKRGYIIKRFLTGYPKGPDWPKPIADLKMGGTEQPSKFIKTYLQSLEAENSGLDEIAGMGYRKAIEYLVKDWAIQAVPSDQAKIESLWLGQIISQYFNGELKEILERATWLGNDQAHYNKLFDDFDLNDLKELIDLIMVELDRQFKLNHYINTIQKRK